MDKRRVVITGLGAISGLGLSASEFWNSLSAGETAIKPYSHPMADVKVSVAATVPHFNPDDFFSSEQLPLLDRFSQLAVMAAQEAVNDAGLTSTENTLVNAGVIIGSGCGGKHTDEETYEKLYKQQRKRAHPLTIPKGMPSAAASMVSMHLGIKGPAFVLSSACSSGAHAIIQGASMIQAGVLDIALVGASDAPFTYGLLKSWDALRVVSNDTCRPFCHDRSGMVLGEGAGMLTLESEEHAKARGVRIYAELTGCGMTSDAGHITRPEVTGITRVMRNALQNSSINLQDVDYINAHGTATIANDIAETEAINTLFGSHAEKIAVSSTKSMHGHALGASSALELVATTLAIHSSIIPPTANFTKADKKCNLDHVPNTARDQKIDVAMSNSFAFGGLNATVILKSYN
ncbi:MAG: beta-ketoacyl-[acyl-carrier-protein] synthase family protein [Methylococcaceae bacterium]